MSKLTASILTGPPLPGWTPNINTYYLVSNSSGKLYVPIPGTINSFAYCYLRDSDVFHRVLKSDYLTVDGTTGGLYPVKVEFLTTVSPYAVKITTVDSEYLLTFWDAMDTVMQLTATNILPLEQSDTYAQVLRLNPTLLWTFNKRYVQTDTRFYVDDKSVVKFTCDEAEIAYPSGWPEAAMSSCRVPANAIVSVAELRTVTSTTSFAYMVHMASDGDCHICTIGNVRLDINGGTLAVTIAGFTHTTSQPVESITIAGSQLVSPSHMFYVLCDGDAVTVIMDGIVIGVYPVVYGTVVGFLGLDTIDIFPSASIRQYSGIAIYDRLIPPVDVLTPASLMSTSELSQVKVTGTNCTRYKSAVTTATINTDVLYIVAALESDRTLCKLNMLANENTVVEYRSYTDDIEGITPLTLTLAKGEQSQQDMWIMADESIIIKVISGSISIRVHTIGEHS